MVRRDRKGDKGFTLIELLVVAAIIGILLALAIPNLIKARISANEANARKSMQTLRDAEGEYFEQDLNNNGSRDFTARISTLRNPDGGASLPDDELVDSSFVGADAGAGFGTASCVDPKAGYCMSWDIAVGAATSDSLADFGWGTSMTNFNKTGRKDFSVYGDGVIRCTVSSITTSGTAGTFDADRTDPGCD